jgi:predicted ribosome-associated RNA-binding protein Tma20
VHQPAASLGNTNQPHDRDQDNADAHNVDTHRERGDEGDAVLHGSGLLVLGLEDANQQHRRGDLLVVQSRKKKTRHEAVN